MSDAEVQVPPPEGWTDAHEPPLLRRLVQVAAAVWLPAAQVADWVAGAGDRVLLLAGDAVRFPEGQDVAVVLPELRQSCMGSAGRFAVGIVPRDDEDAVARRYGSQRWPSLLFFRDGHYVTAVAGMHDWDVFQQRITEALALPASRPPTIGIPVVAAAGAAASCGAST